MGRGSEGGSDGTNVGKIHWKKGLLNIDVKKEMLRRKKKPAQVK